MNIYPVVMAGGSGTRFWPLSRQARPKQFLPLAGDAPLLVDTVARLPPLAKLERTYVVCGPSHAPVVRQLLPKLPKENVIVEPMARNTAPCVGLAALHVARRDPRGVIAMLPADHHVARPAAFRDALAAAAAVAEGGAIATIGVRPTRPETGYGYLKVGPRLATKGKAHPGLEPHKVARFVEKPDAKTAARYLAEGGYLWNAGIFVFRISYLFEELSRLAPGILDIARRAHSALKAGDSSSFAEIFSSSPSISIDVAVMEKARNVTAIPCDCGWSDLGSWEAVFEFRGGTSARNILEGSAEAVDGSGNLVLAEARPVRVVGLSDVVVVESEGGLLVMRRGASDALRRSVEEGLER